MIQITFGPGRTWGDGYTENTEGRLLYPPLLDGNRLISVRSYNPPHTHSRFNVIGLLLLKESSLFAGIGLAIGLIGSVFVGRTMQTTLYRVAAMDFSVMAGVAIVLLMTALFASYLPARRAAMIDPMKALRVD